MRARSTRKLPALFVLALLAPACGLGSSIRGSGVAKSETRALAAFTRVEIHGSAKLDLAAGATGPAGPLTVAADDNLLPFVVTEVRGGTLVVEMKPGSYDFKSPLHVTGTAASLESVAVHGSAVVALTGLAGEKLSIDVQGAGEIRASGKEAAVTAQVSGAGNLRFGDLEARAADITISGAGKADVWATETLSVQIAGAGEVTYKGDPRIQKSISGIGSVERR